MILFENTRIHELCSKLLKIERPSFKDLNFAIASQLGSTLFPSKTSRGGLCGIPEQCPHPGYRLLTVRSIPQVPERSKAFTVRGVRALEFQSFHFFMFQSFHFFMFQLYRSNYKNVTRITHTHNRKKITLENQRSNIGTYVERSVETHESNVDCRFGFGGGYGLDGESKKSRCEQIHLQSYHPSWCERI